MLVLEVGDVYRGTLCQGAVRGADTGDRDFGKLPVGSVRAAGVGKAEDDIHILIFQQTVQVLERDGEKAGMQVGVCLPHFSQDVRKKKLHPEDLITHEFPIEKAGEAYQLMAKGTCGKVAVVFGEE